MGRERLRLLLAAAVASALIVLAIGCGASSSSSSTSAGSANGNPSGKASTDFLKPKSPDNKLVEFGAEAPAAEREAASKVLEENLRAREGADFSTQCAGLNAATIEEIAGAKKGGSTAAAACPAALKALAEPLKGSKKVRADTLGGPIAALRMKGPKGYALYHGTDKKDYAMPMERQGKSWKVAALLATELG